MRRCRNVARDAAAYAARNPDKVIFAFLIIGTVISVVIPGNIYRGWFALAAFVFSVLFVLEYRRRNWRSTFAGRSSMISMLVTIIYTGNVVLILWWPFPHAEKYGYPYWEDATEIIYLLLALAALYKLVALHRAGHPRQGPPDPTAEVKD